MLEQHRRLKAKGVTSEKEKYITSSRTNKALKGVSNQECPLNEGRVSKKEA